MDEYLEAGDSLLKSDVKTRQTQNSPRNCQAQTSGHWAGHAVLVLIIIILVATSRTSRATSAHFPSLEDSIPRKFQESHSVRFNGSIDFRSEWKGLPRPELEAAWNSVTSEGKTF
jgi:hypothetical protein